MQQSCLLVTCRDSGFYLRWGRSKSLTTEEWPWLLLVEISIIFTVMIEAILPIWGMRRAKRLQWELSLQSINRDSALLSRFFFDKGVTKVHTYMWLWFYRSSSRETAGDTFRAGGINNKCSSPWIALDTVPNTPLRLRSTSHIHRQHQWKHTRDGTDEASTSYAETIQLYHCDMKLLLTSIYHTSFGEMISGRGWFITQTAHWWPNNIVQIDKPGSLSNRTLITTYLSCKQGGVRAQPRDKN